MSQFSDFYNVDKDGVVTSPIMRTKFSPRLRVQVPVSQLPSRTKQADAKSADINVIVARYKKTGELPVSKRMALFEDLPAVDLKDAMDLMVRAEQSFAQLPSSVRNKYNNDPHALMADVDNRKDKAAYLRLYEAGMVSEPWQDTPTGKSAKTPQEPSKAPSGVDKGERKPPAKSKAEE